MTPRKYISAGIAALEAAFEQSKQDPPALRQLMVELRHRRTDRAKALSAQVAAQLERLLRAQEIDARENDKAGPSAGPRQVTVSAKITSPSTDQPSEPTVGDHAIAEALNSIRQRLLDLTRRNPLLNYSHSSKRCIRVVDEMPDQLFEELMAPKALAFKPLPRVPRLEEQMPDEIRTFLEGLNDPKKPPAMEWAKLHGIDPSFELPLPASGSIAARHKDSEIQTLLFPAELEARLKLMSQLARTATEESGANILYLAFGFLEWREADHSDQTSLAPLLLVPVSLKKRKGLDQATRREQFTLEYSGEDLQANISLREKLDRDFSFTLPELQDSDTPDSYIDRCRTLLVDQPTWRICRYASLGFFQFGKLLMYLDLDPDRWPGDASITQHAVVRQLLGSEPAELTGDWREPDLDKLPLTSPEAHLIEEADSSQHAAIIEAAKGRNLVIEGPPGTGKSQTITNIIGVALAQGKTVLFVSEKLAALEVVHSRLESAGLGQFCLELHSHKTQKRKFIDDIAERIDAKASAPSESTIRRQRERYQMLRDQIAEHLRLVNGPVPGYSGTVRHLFCEAAWLKQQLRCRDLALSYEDIGPIEIEGGLEAIQAASIAAQRARENVRALHGDLASHPWSGLLLRHAKISFEIAQGSLAEWHRSVAELLKNKKQLDAISDMPDIRSYRLLRSVGEYAEQLEDVLYENFQINELLRLPAALPILIKLIEHEKSLERAATDAALHWHMEQTTADALWAQVAAFAQALLHGSVDLRARSLDELIRIADCLSQLETQVQQASDGILEIERVLDFNLPASSAGLGLAAKILALAASRPSTDALAFRSDTTGFIDNTEALQTLVDERAALLLEKSRLSLQFDVSKPLDLPQLCAICDALSRSTLFSFLNAEWRSADALYQRLRIKKARFRSVINKLDDLNRLQSFQEKLNGFLHDGRYSRLLGSEFRGLETPAEEILDVVKWNEAIRESLGRLPDSFGNSGKRLMGLAASKLDELDALERSGLRNTFTYTERAVQQLAATCPELVSHLFRDGWGGLPQHVRDLYAAVSQAVEGLFQRLREEQRQNRLSQSLHILEETAQLLSEPERLAAHEQLLAREHRSVWSADTLAKGERLASILRRIELESERGLVRQALAVADPTARQLLQACAAICRRCDAAQTQADELFSIDERTFLGGSIAQTPLPALVERLAATEINETSVEAWMEITRAVDRLAATEAGLEQLRTMAFSEGPDDTLLLAARHLVLNRMADDAVAASPKLRNFSAGTHDELIAAFRKADDDLKDISRALIAAELNRRQPPSGSRGLRAGDFTEMALLRKETNRQTRHLPIRKVVARAGRALQALKPCFMMGPLSVAQYLDPGKITFDLVVMDEASQMRPEDALGTVARGKQLIVVGDPKQLPPTNFFDYVNADGGTPGDGTLVFGTQESILDLAMPLFAPPRTLTWHYRSKHEQLIAFSNHSFYDKKLLLFPTVHTSAEHLGIAYRRVDGTYQNHTNVVEAQQLIREVVHEIRSGRGRSIGIAAVNSAQAQVLRDEWDRMTREFPDLRELLYEDDDNLQQLFIKNLENVQGDERDVIFVSLTYGRDANRNFYQRFGPINREDGWRRLNVLFTRAREQMVVFSSMDSAMIVPGPDANRGVVALKDFLSFCETSILPEGARPSGRSPESPFEEDVAAAVRECGLEVECQVGVAGFFIDIGVIDPGAPGEYLMGIECDGATYHSTRSVRDRDKIRQGVLENLGWKIHRIWSTDWFKNETRERQKLRESLQQAYAEAESRRQASLAADRAPEKQVEPEVSQSVECDGDKRIASSSVPIDSEETQKKRDLRQKLLELRTTIEEDFPDTPRDACLLSDDLIDILVAVKPTDPVEFHRSVPLERRRQIDMEQSRAYLSTVLMIVEEA